MSKTCQAVKPNLFLYADEWCPTYQRKDVEEIEKQPNKDFENVCDWFVDNGWNQIYSFCK